MLHKMGVEKMDVAGNGVEALACIDASEKVPDIIICDLQMPELDGIAFLRHLAKKKFAGGIILISGGDQRILRMATQLAEAHRLNVLGTLSKPFHHFRSSAALEDLLARFKETNKQSQQSSLPSVTPEALRAAIEQGQLVPFFQPKVNVKTGAVIGVEALARWQHPDRGLIPPVAFIPVAEQHGLIDMLTEDMLLKTLNQVSIWHKHGLKFTAAINFSALSLADVSLPDRLETELRKVGLDPSCLTLEVTESCLLENITASMETLLRLRLKGISLSIDDFGTGHSSLEQLHRVPFSELKIDRLFVNGAAHDKEALLLFESAMTLAKQLNLVTVAEGVETQEDWNVCARLGCYMAQGFLIARPMPNDAFLEWYAKRRQAD